jgi:hypothetical protein
MKKLLLLLLLLPHLLYAQINVSFKMDKKTSSYTIANKTEVAGM